MTKEFGEGYTASHGGHGAATHWQKIFRTKSPELSTIPARVSFYSSSLVVVLLLGLVGCRPPLQTSEQARPLPLLDRDPAEDGIDADRWAQWRGRNGSGVASAAVPL